MKELCHFNPTKHSTSLLDLEQSGADLDEFIGSEVNVISIVSDKLKFAGILIKIDRLNGCATVEDSTGTLRLADFRETLVRQ